MIYLIVTYLVTLVLNFYLFYKWVGEVHVFQLLISVLIPPVALIATITTYMPNSERKLTINLRGRK